MNEPTLRSSVASHDACERVCSMPESGPRPRSTAGLVVGMTFGEDGRYQLGQRIGVGGTSVVHEVLDRTLNRRLAGKFLLLESTDPDDAGWQLEARALARLQHPGVVTLHEVGTLESIPYLLLEMLEGHTLLELLADGPLPPQQALDIVISLCVALSHAHAAGIHHLDLKPGNVHVSQRGVVKLLDFGAGSASAAPRPEGVEPSVVGTPGYMAPEQWRGAWPDARTDVWAVGTLLYECLTGETSERRNGAPRTLLGRSSISKLSARLSLPGLIDLVIAKALAPDPAQRFASVAQMLVPLRIVRQSVLDDALRALPSLELQLTASTAALGEVTLEQLQASIRATKEGIGRALSRLVDKGVIERRVLGQSIRYVVRDEAFAAACLLQMPKSLWQPLMHELCRPAPS